MALDPPPALKQADLNLYKCATRCNQLRAHKPIVAYWCDYWVVNQILAQGLHTADSEIMTYTMALMDKLEQAKAEQANEEAVTDDDAGKAYIQQFAQETLDRAQKVVMANRVTGNTANTFDAAATFLNLMNIWGPADPETRQKIKYAKWNAVRILKAIKEGTDPNESNPRPEQPEAEEATKSPADPDAQAPTGAPSGPRPVSVEEVADSESKRNSAVVSLPDTTAAVPSPLAREDMTLPDAAPESPSASQFYTSQPGQQQPEYFDPQGAAPPAMPSPMSPPLAPSAPSDLPQAWTPSPPPSANAPFPPPSAPATGPPTFAPSSDATPAVASPPINPPPSSYMDMTPNPSIARPVIPPPSAAAAPPIVPQMVRQNPPAPVVAPVVAPAAAPPASGYITDDLAIAKAQKHARWAISALNFEDVPTAVKELRNALETLGAT